VYIFVAIRELFTFVTGLKYLYKNSPSSIKAIIQAISSLVTSVGSTYIIGLTPITYNPYLVIFYTYLTIIIA
ncbi:hypothetical protein P154DRAFT_379100, partial [Amniculicola lignicola CBS 123094]